MNNRIEHTNIVIINDNNMGFLGGERESQLIIINAICKFEKISVIQPGVFKEEIENVNFYWKTRAKRMKSLIKNPFAFIAYFFKVASLIKKIHPVVIHSNSQVSFFIVSFLMRFRLIPRNIRFIHTDRGLYVRYNSFFRLLFKWSFRYLDELVTTTAFNKECWMIANKKLKHQPKYSVIENTAGLIYETIDYSKILIRDFLTIGFAGRMCDWKGWPLAEGICNDLDGFDHSFNYIMYVSCLDNDSKKKTEKMFERMRTKFGDRFIGKINVPFSEMEQFYYDIDIFVLTSWPKSESFGRTIVEAMSRKTAVLTTDAGGSVEVVGDPNTIHHSSKEFASHIVFLKNNPTILQKIKDDNFKRVRNNYSLYNNISKYKNLYLKYLGKEEV